MSSVSKKLRLAIIGGGLFARNNHIPQILKLQDIITVVAVWSNSKSSAELAASLFDKYA
jgi:predicted dehydrogenase